MKRIQYLIVVLLNVTDGSTRHLDFYYNSKKKIRHKDLEMIRNDLLSKYNREKDIVENITFINVIKIGKVKIDE